VHELKTPLTAILASTELFVDELKNDRRLPLAQNIYQAAKNLDRRTDELLDVSRGEIGLLSVSPKTEQIKPLLENTIEILRPAAVRKNHDLRSEISDDLPPVAVDEDRLGQVLYNYLANAIKYTPAGGRIILRAFSRRDELIVEVTDNGPGITPEGQRRLFEPYYQVPRNGGEKLGGLGLGLSLSKMIVSLHGGRVWVNSTPGQGAKFGFALPLSERIGGQK
jgi:signal transduction histidine kinase